MRIIIKNVYKNPTIKGLGVIIACIFCLPLNAWGQESSDISDQWIVFGSFRGGDFSSSVHAIRPNGSSEYRLSLQSLGRPASLDPSVSSDGSLIFFTRGGSSHRTSVWMLNRTTQEETKLTSDVMVRFRNGRAWPSLRPSHSNELIYVKEIGQIRHLTLAKLDQGTTTDLGLGEFPNWSPDGTKLVYTRGSRIWIQTPGADDAGPINSPLKNISWPNWSPNGNSLIVSANLGNTSDLYEVGLDGTIIRQLTNTPGIAELSASWSPDGRLIAYTAPSSNPPDGWQNSIYILNLLTNQVTEITSTQYNDTRPSWITVTN